MEGKDNIKELFSQKLGSYEAKVNPELWAKISSQVAAGASTTAASGLSLLAKIAIGVGVSAAAIATVVILSTTKSEEIPLEKPVVQFKETPSNSADESQDELISNDQKEVSNETQSGLELTASNKKKLIPLDESLYKYRPYMPSVDVPPGSLEKSWDFNFHPMLTKDVDRVNDSKSEEPQIVEGRVYVNTTNYGSSTDPDETPEVVVVKSEPIKRYTNVFTPNGDGINDHFELESRDLTDFSIVIFNSKGDIVYKSTDANFKWDGRDIRTNELVPSGENYMYMVSSYDSEGNPYPIYERLRIITN